MKSIWLIRHGQSRSQTGEEGWADPSLSDLGVRQVKCLKPVMVEQYFDHIRISPLLRARQTYELALIKGNDISLDSRLIECSYGRSYNEILPYLPPKNYKADNYQAWDLSVKERVRSLFNELRNLSGESILLIGHWAFFSVLALYSMGIIDLDEPYRHSTKSSMVMDNAAFSILVLNHPRYGNSIAQWNNRSHVENLIEKELL